MPSESPQQQRFMGAEYARKKAGKKTRTGMSLKRLREFARKPTGGYADGGFVDGDVTRGYRKVEGWP